MAWITNITKAQKDNGDIVLSVEFINGEEKVNKSFRIDSIRNIKGFLRGELTRLQNLDDLIKTISLGVIDLTPEPEIPVTPEPPNPERDAFLNALNAFRDGQRLFDSGIITPTQLATLKTTLKGLYKPEYLELL